MEGDHFHYVSILYKNDFHRQTFIFVSIWAASLLAMKNNNIVIYRPNSPI